MNTEAVQGIFNAQEISTIQMFTAGFNTFGVDLLAIPKDYGIFSWYIMSRYSACSNIGSLVMTMIKKTRWLSNRAV